MRFQKDVEYCLISLLAMGSSPGLLSAAVLAERFRIPRSLLAKLLQRLQRRGLIEAVRGPRGGYLLRRPMEEITVQEVIEAVHGPERLAACLQGESCEQAEVCTIRSGVESLQGIFESFLASLTLAQLGRLQGPGGVELPGLPGGPEAARSRRAQARAPGVRRSGLRRGAPQETGR